MRKRKCARHGILYPTILDARQDTTVDILASLNEPGISDEVLLS